LARLLVIDDHEVVREGLQAALSAMPSVELVGAAATGAEGLQLARRTIPEIVVADFRLPDMPGDELCARLVALLPSVAVVMLTTYASEDIVRRVVASGASRFVTKASGLSELRRAIESVLRGEPRPAGGGAAIVERLERVVADPAMATLTARQEGVLELAAAGLTYGQIAERLIISESTVRFHIQALKTKLGTKTKTELITTAIRLALIDPVGSDGPLPDDRPGRTEGGGRTVNR
jgi:DNA-binding NarL/FixJ family response regulator